MGRTPSIGSSHDADPSETGKSWRTLLILCLGVLQYLPSCEAFCGSLRFPARELILLKERDMSMSALRKQASKSVPQSEFQQVKKRRPFTVLLVVDDADERAALVKQLQQQKLEVRDYMTAMEFYRDYREKVPGVLIMEARLRGMTGVELQEKLAEEKFELPVVLIAGHADAPLAVRSMISGAFDFLVKPIRETELFGVVARAYSYYYDVDSDVVGEDLNEIEEGIRRLSDREKQILDFIVQGRSSRDIGSELGISSKTVEAHRARINDKMRAIDLPHLVRMCRAWNEEHES